MIKQQWVALYTLSRREISRFCRIWTQTFLPQVMTISLYFIVFGRVIGDRVGDVNGHAYIEFITPGLVIMGIMNNSYANVVSSFFGSKFSKNIEEMYVSSMSSLVILIGFLLGGMCRGLIIGLLSALVAACFVPYQIHHPFALVLVAVITSIVFATAGLINGIYATKFDDVNIVPAFILAPLTYLGGAFYSVTMLPSWWQSLSHFNPIFYTVNTFRWAMIGASDIEPTQALLGLSGLCIILLTWAYRLLDKGTGVRT